ncbi:alpha/beta hydrolase [Rubrivirga sp. IMCC43871]|uniref:alpha/beta hydrolase n=1 Tax=Rubrivirga sp. IMCC43871 TaxID=3391575 RepID=UPI00398FC0E0
MTGPHDRQPLVAAGALLAEAPAAVVLVHGRGDSARGILGLTAELPDTLAYLAPQAAAHAWYPQSFLAPLAANEPGLSSGIAAVLRAVATAEAAGIDRGHIVLAGFSQGACLAAETAARTGGRWGGVVVLSGGLLGTGPGPDDAPTLLGAGGRYLDKAFDYDTSLAGTPVVIGCSDVDPHIPLARVERTAAVLAGLGAEVDARIYPGMGHAVNADEIAALRALLASVSE